MTLDGANVVVTGAGSGIGEATAVHLAAEGARVVVADVAEPDGHRVTERIVAAGGTAHFVPCDVSIEGSVEELIARSVELTGGLDLAVNNAGIGDHPGDLHEMDVGTWDQVMAVDLRGTFLCLRAEIGVMLRAGKGSIVNMASNAGVKNAPGMAAYTAAKHGIVGLTKNAALQYARRGIRVNAVCPGTIGTPAIRSFPPELQGEWGAMIPMGRIGTPEEVAEAVSFLLSDRSAFITGIALLADGGLMYA
ncbi:MAG TPA: SDR family NAD(P)-dependent oxidoreductase [Acidimicrobiales bacterium]|jgi:hypothetical protein|nr:SDR family NAD(P)-dependent oxidoreductase [Acidimicrobiales bacterium]